MEELQISQRISRVVRASNSPLDQIWSVIARLNIVADGAEEAQLLRRLASPDRPMIVSFVNQHSLNLAWSMPGFASTLRSADVLLRDGVGLECCLKLNRCPTGLNMNGTDFIPKLVRAYAGRRVALFGTEEPWTGRAAEALEEMGCSVVSSLDGFRSVADYAAEMTRTQPDLVILAMGVPKQEHVAAALVRLVNSPLVIVNGGAIADFWAQRFLRAPGLVQRLRLEWMYRLALEPRRLMSRYLTGGSIFAWRLILLRQGSTSALVRLLHVRLTNDGPDDQPMNIEKGLGRCG